MKKIGETTLQAEVYKMQRTVLKQPITGLFQDCVSAFLENLSSDQKKEEFHDYFI